MTIVALFVDRCGPYYELLGAENCWDETRDARSFDGPGTVIAHPPCERWGRYWSGGPNASFKRELGSDGGCFQSAIGSVVRFGGVLEHPEASHAFRVFGLGRPHYREGWKKSDCGRGLICCVAQGNYGHRSRKLTWLFTTSVKPPELDWSVPSGMARLDAGYHSKGHRERKEGVAATVVNRLTTDERIATPMRFARVMIQIAESCQ